METLFRFIVTRPAQQVEVDRATVGVQPRPDYRKSLDGARAAEDPVPALRRAAAAYRNANGAWTLAQLPLHDALVKVVAAIAGHKQMTMSQLTGAFSAAFSSMAGSTASRTHAVERSSGCALSTKDT